MILKLGGVIHFDYFGERGRRDCPIWIFELAVILEAICHRNDIIRREYHSHFMERAGRCDPTRDDLKWWMYKRLHIL